MILLYHSWVYIPEGMKVIIQWTYLPTYVFVALFTKALL
jgi:hypothetical protein